MRAIAAPHRMVRSIETTPWVRATSAGVEELGDGVPEWDTSIELRFQRRVTLEHSVLLTESGLAEDSVLRLVASWYCPATRTRHVASRDDVVLGSKGKSALDVAVKAPGENIAAAFELETVLVLISAADGSFPTAAERIGTILWRDARPVVIEGVASRFPIEWIDFTKSPYPDEASWYLDWSPEAPEYSVLGGLRLYLNAKKPALRKLLEDSESTESKLFWNMIRVDVTRQLIFGLINSPEFVKDPTGFADDTVAATVRRLINVLFPGESIDSVRELVRQRPARVESQIQARLHHIE